MVKKGITNRLAEFRKRERIGATELARRVKVSRQTIYAIEGGTFNPNTDVALSLARELKTTVEELFSPPQGIGSSEFLTTELLSAAAPAKGHPVRISKIGRHWVSVPVSAIPYYLPAVS